MLATGIAHLFGAVALGEHDHGAACGLKLVNKAIHASGRGRAEGAGGHAGGGFGGAGIINRVVLEIVGHGFARIQPLADLGMGEVARHDHGARQRETGLDRMLGQGLEDLGHGLVEVDLHHIATEMGGIDLRHETGGIMLQLLDEHTVTGDLAHGLTVCRAGNRQSDGQRGSMAWQTHHAHIMAEIFTTELRADPHLLGQLVDFSLHRHIAEGMGEFRALLRQSIKITGRGELGRFQGQFRRQTADDDGQVIGRAGRGAEREDLLMQEFHHAVMGEDGGRGLIEEGLVGRAATLAMKRNL